MELPVETIVAIAVPAAGVIVWLVRLEGRINLTDARHQDIKEDLTEIKAALGIRGQRR